jgi:hypothetical protein
LVWGILKDHDQTEPCISQQYTTLRQQWCIAGFMFSIIHAIDHVVALMDGITAPHKVLILTIL